jgi:hypothetical protein
MGIPFGKKEVYFHREFILLVCLHIIQTSIFLHRWSIYRTVKDFPDDQGNPHVASRRPRLSVLRIRPSLPLRQLFDTLLEVRGNPILSTFPHRNEVSKPASDLLVNIYLTSKKYLTIVSVKYTFVS